MAVTNETNTLRDIDRLLEAADGGEATRLKVLHNALVKTTLAVESDPSEANLRAYEKADRLFTDMVRRLDEKYFPSAPPPRVWKTRLDALKYLQDQGYKVGRSKLYKDAASGLLALEPDGSVTEKALKRYVRLAGLKKLSEIAAARGPDPSDLAVTKQKREIERLTEQVSKMRLEREILEGRHIPKDEVYLELAGRAGMFELGLRELFQDPAKLREMIATVGGDIDRTEDLRELVIGWIVTKLREFAELGEFEIEVRG